MSYVITSDGTQFFYMARDDQSSSAHGWPPSADSWERRGLVRCQAEAMRRIVS
jgi:hypothetical protein